MQNQKSNQVYYFFVSFLYYTIIFFLFFFKGQISYASKASEVIIDAWSNQNWPLAIQQAKNINDPILAKILLSQQLLDKNYEGNTFSSITSFIKKNPNWPQNVELIKRAEELAREAKSNEIIEWFTTRRPQTGLGYKYYALVSAKKKDLPNKSEIIKKGWIYGAFDDYENFKYLIKYNNYLQKEDHYLKIDNLLNQKNIDLAKFLLPLVLESQQKTLETKIAILQNNPNAEEMFNSLIKSQAIDQNLLYSYLRYKIKDTLPHKSLKNLINLWHKLNINEQRHKWAAVYIAYTRELIKYRDYKEAYNLISQYKTNDHINGYETEWLAGWIALRFLYKPDLAKTHFLKMHQFATQASSIARSSYWLGRTYSFKHDKIQARLWWEKAAKYNHTFYGQLALLELNKKNTLQALPQPKELTNQNDIELLNIIKTLLAYNKTDLAMIFSRKLFAKLTNPGQIIFVFKNLVHPENTGFNSKIGRLASNKGVLVAQHALPMPYNNINTSKVPLPLIHAVIKQESDFDINAYDPKAQDSGLMQIIPNTARNIANRLGEQYDLKRLLVDPHFNIRFGSYYLKEHLNYYKGSYILAIAAYNAGSSRVDKWLKTYGDPRHFKNIASIIDWIELIPFPGTRKHVQRIIENLQVYYILFNNKSSSQLKHDLLRKHL